MQQNLVVNNSAHTMTGTIKYLSSGYLVDTYGAGNFIALKFNNIPEDATSVKVGINTPDTEIITNPDKNGAFKIGDKNTDKFIVEITSPDDVIRIEYSLSGLTTLSNIPTISQITAGLRDQLDLFEQRLDGNRINPADIETIPEEEDAYYKTNTEYLSEIEYMEQVLNGVD